MRKIELAEQQKNSGLAQLSIDRTRYAQFRLFAANPKSVDSARFLLHYV